MMDAANNNGEHNKNNEKSSRNGRWFRLFGSPRFRKALRIIWNNPKLFINAIYSFFVCFRLFGLKFYRFPVIADFGSKIRKAHKAKLEIQGRLYLGGRYIGDQSGADTYMKLPRGTTCRILGRVKLGPGVRVILEPGANFSIGDNTYITAASIIHCSTSISIGRDCAIAWGTTIMDTDFHSIVYEDGNQNSISKPIVIGDKVWIGCNCTILKGVTIGNNNVIAANSLVNRDVPPNSLVAGNPARVVKTGIDWLA
jgi:acetyltransferase-like isoleucine patch superfamily enzyme